MFLNDTIAAISTGMNNSGIGIIRISGPESFRIASSIFFKKSGQRVDDFESHRIYYGFIKENEEIVDEVLLSVFKSPKSFTCEDTIEINCHGGNLVMRKILKIVLDNGARIAEPGEFTKRAFLNGRIDLSRAEAIIDIINSKNDYSLNNSVKQLTGRLYEKINEIRDKIKYEIAFIESAIDDPENYSLDGYYDNLKKTINGLLNELNILKRSFKEGKIISEGIKTVIIGKPNVGKSSLLNLLTGEDTAIVTDIAGTTRDIIEQNIIVGGLSLNIIDTAGIRETDDIIEKIGVERTYKYADEADLIIMVIDSSSPIDESDIYIFKYIENKNAIILFNKSDLKMVVSEDDVRKYTDKSILQISAKDETGIDEFKSKIEMMFAGGLIDYNDEVIITNERHIRFITDSIVSLNEVMKSIDNDMPEDFVSIDLLNTYKSLGCIIGETLEDDIVNEIFNKFCMGK